MKIMNNTEKLKCHTSGSDVRARDANDCKYCSASLGRASSPL